ncbi:MAG: NAD(P)-binding domain-containing protein, partial [Planctomycetes bacterium]|nr:NAD(P)-binding domain-containing protein [Planctomycetota bacterium]
MNVAILGAGAMGTVLGAYLATRGAEPLMIDSNPDHVAELIAHGARVVGCAELTVPVRAVTPERIPDNLDIVFLFVKQTASRAALAALVPHLGGDATVCTLQNGLPEPLVAEIAGAKRTMGGACLWGATYVRPGVVELTNPLESRPFLFEIGEPDGSIAPRTRAVAAELEKMGPVTITDNLMGARWLKLMLNCSMSGLSTALGCVFGKVLDHPKAWTCLSYLAAEVVQVARAAGVVMAVTNDLDAGLMADIATGEKLERSKKLLLKNYDALRTAKASMLQ